MWVSVRLFCAFIGEQKDCPYRDIILTVKQIALKFLRNKHVTLIGSLLGDKQTLFIKRQVGCPNWGTYRLPLLRGKQVALIVKEFQ